jgi:hypothetical protein
MQLFYNQKDEFPDIIRFKKNTSVCYISDYEIINEEIYNNLKKHMGELNLNSKNDDNKKIDYIIFNNKIIFKYINNQELCFNLLSGSFNDNNLYIPEVFVNYKNKNDLEDEFKNLFDPNNTILSQYDNNIKINNKDIFDITKDFNSENENNYNFKNIIFYTNGYPNLNGTKYTNNPNVEEKHEIDSKKIAKFFIKLFLEYKDIKKKSDDDSNNNYYDLEYIIINKNWIDKFKKKFCYSEFIESIIENNLIKDIDGKNPDDYINNIPSEYLKKINTLINKDLIYELSNICLCSLNYDYC